MDSMPGSPGCDIGLVFTFPPKDRTLQYKNAYTSEITFLVLVPWIDPSSDKEIGDIKYIHNVFK